MPKGKGYSGHGKMKGKGKLRSPFGTQKAIAGKGGKSMPKKRGSSKRR